MAALDQPVVVPPLAWWGLGAPTQVALSWLLNASAGKTERPADQPYASDLPYLRGLQRDGFARCADGRWEPTDAAYALAASKHEPATWRPASGGAV